MLHTFPNTGYHVPPCHTDRYTSTLIDLHTEFNWPFSDFAKTEQELELVSSLFSFDCKKAPQDVQLELIDIQWDQALNQKFTPSTLDNFCGSLKEPQFRNMRRQAQRMLILFGSTYVCEQNMLFIIHSVKYFTVIIHWLVTVTQVTEI